MEARKPTEVAHPFAVPPPGDVLRRLFFFFPRSREFVWTMNFAFGDDRRCLYWQAAIVI